MRTRKYFFFFRYNTVNLWSITHFCDAQCRVTFVLYTFFACVCALFTVFTKIRRRSTREGKTLRRTLWIHLDLVRLQLSRVENSTDVCCWGRRNADKPMFWRMEQDILPYVHVRWELARGNLLGWPPGDWQFGSSLCFRPVLFAHVRFATGDRWSFDSRCLFGGNRSLLNGLHGVELSQLLRCSFVCEGPIRRCCIQQGVALMICMPWPWCHGGSRGGSYVERLFLYSLCCL